MSAKDKFLKYVPAAEREAFGAAVDLLAADQGNPAIWYLAVMFQESGLNPASISPISGGGGLIGFMPFTAREMGTSVEELRNMSRLEQLEYVRRYYDRADKKFRDFADFYFFTFYPYAIGKKASYIIGSERSMEYAHLVAKQNPIFDLDKDGFITVREFRKYLWDKFPELRWSTVYAKVKRFMPYVLLVVLFVLIIFFLHRFGLIG
jgi:hypothetical protein